jgi:hypothetical protein
VWKGWYVERSGTLCDKDGLELARSSIWLDLCNEWQAKEWQQWAEGSPARRKLADLFSGKLKPCTFRYPRIVSEVVEWLLFLFPCDARDYLLDAVETAFALVPSDEMAQLKEPAQAVRPNVLFGHRNEIDWRDAKAFDMWTDALGGILRITGLELTPAQQVRLWQLMHWRDEPYHGARRRRPDTSLLRTAYAEGAANLADVADHLLGPRGTGQYRGEGFCLLEEVNARKPDKDVEAWLIDFPEVRALVDRAIARILELELGRGDAPTAATAPAHSLGTLKGIETLRRILHALGKDGFKLGRTWHSAEVEDRRQTLTHLARVTYPSDDKTPDDFASTVKQAIREDQFPEERLLQLTFLAPQWTKFVEAYLNWSQMSEGVYWFLAHMQYIGGLGEIAAEAAVEEQPDGELAESCGDTMSESAGDAEGHSSTPLRRKLSAWDRLILERTPLSAAERSEGAIDVP